MNRPAPPDPLDRALAEVPRAAASEDFTARVLRALDGSRARPTGRRLVLGWAILVVAAVAVTATLGMAIQRQRAADRAYRQELETLRREYRSLVEEAATVRREATAPARLHLGGDERVDLVLDLSQPSLDEAPGEIRPAALGAPGPNTREPRRAVRQD